MISVSNDFKKAMKQPIKELDAYIELADNSKITSATDLISFKISCDSGMCKTAMRKLEAKYLGEHNLLGQWVHVGYGVRLSTGTFEYLDYGSFLITEITTAKDTGVTTIVGYDKMINAMTQYELLDIEYPIDLYTYTRQLCEVCDLELGNLSFNTHNNWIITQELWENISGITYRDILVQIAQATASTCIIGYDNKVYFKEITPTNENLTYDNMKKLKLEPLYGEINSVILSRTPQEDNIFMKDEESIKNNGLTEYKIENNEIIDKDRDNAITPIYNALHGISYYPFETTTEGLGWYEIADNFDIINDTGDVFNTSLFNFSITIDGGIKEILKTVADTKTQTQYQYATTISKRIANTELIVDKQNGKIEAIVEETDVQNQKISKVTQTVEELNSKISDIADITISGENDYAFVELDNINTSEPIRINIKPNSDDISYLYPCDSLYPSDTLYLKNRKIRFINKTTEEIFDYELPDNLFFYDNDNYDEFILDYDAQSCIINKKVGINADGSKYLLDTQTTIEYDYPKIELTDGDYKIELLGYSNAYIFVRLMSQNIYTTQFATRAEMNSQINQTSEEINLEVSKKVGEDEIISKINQTSEEVKVNASKISLEGIITANGNVKITEDGSIEVHNGTFNGDIYLPTGGKVIGGDGILTNLQFASDTKFNELGFYSAMSSEANYRSQIVINADIPSNFTVTSAKLTLVHVPVKWHDGSSGASFWGRSQNIRVYKTNSVSNMYFELYAHSDGSFLNEESKYEIANAFSGGYFTASSASDNSHSAQTVETVDMSSYFTASGLHRITLQSADSIPNYTGVYSTDLQNTYQKTGYVFAILNILGYTSMN